MRPIRSVALCLFWPLALGAQTQQSAGTALTEQTLYSLYVARHAAAVKLADLGVLGATHKDVKKFAEKLAKEERDVGARLRAEAAKGGIAITALSGRDTTDAMLEAARRDLHGKTGMAFDSVWTNRAYEWLSTMVLDNNVNVSGKLPDGDLKKFAQAYSTFHFRLVTEAAALRKKLN